MSLSLRWRLTLSIAASLAVALAAIFVVLSFALRQNLTADLDQELSHDVVRISASLLIRTSVEDRDAVQEIVNRQSVGGLHSGFAVLVHDPQGNVVAYSAGVDPAEFSLNAGEVQRVLSGEVLSRNLDIAGGEEVRVRTSRSVSPAGDAIAIVQVAESTDVISRSLDRLRDLFIGVGAGAVVVVLVVAYWLSLTALRRIEKVTALAERIEASDLTRRIDASRQPAEVQRLSDTFDGMLERLDRAFRQQRNFVLDVAHELRTPLTALRGNIDVLLMGDDLPSDLRLQLERMSGETSRLIRLTTNLLYLAMADAGHELDRRPVEMDVVCLEVYRLLRDLRSGVTLRLGNEDQVSVVGDRDLLKQMVLNLVENGLKYTPDGGEVTLSLYSDEARAQVVIEDTGRGLSPDEIPHIFERFYRGSNSGRGSGGAGIGLAIVDWIVRVHGGEIKVESEPGKGSRFTVFLPTASIGPGSSAPLPERNPSAA
jgi:heavy metal sensor kinase